MKANFTEHFFPWNEIFPWSSNKLYLLQKDFWENSFSYFFSDLKPNREKVKCYLADFLSIKGGEDDISSFRISASCSISSFSYPGVLYLKMTFFPTTISASCSISLFSYLSIFCAWRWYFFPPEFLPPVGFLYFLIWEFFVPEDDISSLQNFRLLLDFFILSSGYFSAWRWYFFPSKFLSLVGFIHFFYLGIFVPEDDIFSLQNFCLLLDFFILFSGYFCAWTEYDIFSLHNLCLLLEFLLTRNQQTFVHQSEEGGGYSDFHARLNPNTSYRF